MGYDVQEEAGVEEMKESVRREAEEAAQRFAAASGAAGGHFMTSGVRIPQVTRETDIDIDYERLRASARTSDDDLWEGTRPLVSQVLQGLMGGVEPSPSSRGPLPEHQVMQEEEVGTVHIHHEQQPRQQDEQEEVQEDVKASSLSFDPKWEMLEEQRKKLEEAKAITREVEARRIYGNR